MLVITAFVIFVIYYLVKKLTRCSKIDRFSHRYIFISGCDSGFGRQLAIHLDSLGFPVFAACFTDGGQHFLSENASDRLVTISLDLSKAESIYKAVDFVKQKLPPQTGLWAFVNNTGIHGPPVDSELLPLEEVHKALTVNVIGPAELSRKLYPLVRMCEGRIVHLTSIPGRYAVGNCVYNASNLAIVGYSATLRREVGNSIQTISVAILEPGSFMTNFTSKSRSTKASKDDFELTDADVHSVDNKHKITTEVSGFTDLLECKSNPDLGPIVDAYTHAIVSKFPKGRYVIGMDARFRDIALSYLPTELTDWIFFRK